MKIVVCQRPGKFRLETKPIPASREGFSLLRVKCIGICGTDIHAFEGNQPFFSYPRVLGHELSAEIVYTARLGFQKGDRVTIIPYFHCGHCIACRNGYSNCCSNLEVFGVHRDGGMAEYILVPDFSLVASQGLNEEQLAVVEPYAIAAHGIRRASVRKGENVLIVGMGPIGIAAATIALLKGAVVTVVDSNEVRLEYCKKILNVKNCIHAGQENVLDRLLTYTDGDLASVVIDATGSLTAINNSFNYLAHAGRYILIGLQRGDICFNHPEFHKREASLLSSRNATLEDFEEVIAYMKSGAIDSSNYITHHVSINSMERDFPKLLDPDSKVLKALVHF